MNTVGLELPLRVLRHVLLLSHLLALDTVLQVEPSQARHSDSFVCEYAMEELGSIFESVTRPILKGLVARQKFDMMLFELGHLSITSWLPSRLQRIPTYVLNGVVWDTKCFRNLEVREIFR